MLHLNDNSNMDWLAALVFYLSLVTQNTLQICYSGLVPQHFGLKLLSSLKQITKNRDTDGKVKSICSSSG